MLAVEHEGQPAAYLHAMHLDVDTLVGTLDDRTLRVATATMGWKHAVLPEEQARAEITRPTYALPG